LDVQSDKIVGFDEGDISLLRTLANQVTVAMRNARLFREVETALAETRTAQERYLAQAWDTTKIVTRGRQYRYTRSDAPLLDEVAVTEAKQRVLLQNRPAIITINSKLVDRQTSDEELDIQTQNAKPENCNSFALVAPVILGNKTIGALQLHRLNSTAGVERGDQPWSDQDLTLVEAVLDQVAQVAENLRLFEETRERAEREQTIREITERMRAATSLEELVKTTAHELGERLSAGRAVVELGLEPETHSSISVSNRSDNGQ
jgi:GAF domain-containing protein